MPRTKTKSDDVVLAAAQEVLLARGPHAFTLADVAQKAGLSAATLIQRFGSKQGLLIAFARRGAQHGAEPFERASREESSPLRALRRALVYASRDVITRRKLANSLALLLEDVRDPTLRRAAAEQARKTESCIRQLLEQAVTRKELSTNDPAWLARLVHAAWNGALIQWGLRGEGPLDEWLSSLLDPLLDSRPERPSRSHR